MTPARSLRSGIIFSGIFTDAISGIFYYLGASVKKERDKMPWNKENYPQSMKNLTPEVREKAIEIANKLYEKENYEEGRVIAIATDTAEEWAKNRGKKVKKD